MSNCLRRVISISLILLSGCFCIGAIEIIADVPADSVVIDVTRRKQYIRNFGASDAWACQFVGNWPFKKKKQVADWLFSKDFDDKGNPKGIGLSLWRFNIGAGSASQENISDPWRRAESFLMSDGQYDWNKQKGQQWFLGEAKRSGVENFLAFTNSPPVQLTKNGKAFASSGTEANISGENHLAFAKFLTDVLGHFDQQGLGFDYVSPFNEPQWDWTSNKQEGTPFTNEEIYSVTRLLDSLLSRSNISAKIQIAEAARLNYLFENADKATRGDQISQFFHASSNLYLGDLQKVDKVISGHSYFTTHPVKTLYDVRSRLAEKVSMSATPIEFWQSEYCILGSHEEVKPQGKDLGIDPALYVARIIHYDLTVANASSWSWWLAISPYDFKDGLIYAERNESDGTVEDSKMLWALGNFSRFIRPGAQRIDLTSANPNVSNPVGVMLSSYLNTDGKLVIVAINYSGEDHALHLDIKNGAVKEFDRFLTGPGEDEKLKFIGIHKSSQSLTIPRRSILTLVGKLNKSDRRG